MTEESAISHTARDLARAVRFASRRYAADYGWIAYPESWWQAPRNPSQKFALLIENLFCRAVMSISEDWRVRLDRDGAGEIIGMILSAPGRLAVHPVKFTNRLLNIDNADGSMLPALQLAEGGEAIIQRVAGLCAEFFGDNDQRMSPPNKKPSPDIRAFL